MHEIGSTEWWMVAYFVVSIAIAFTLGIVVEHVKNRRRRNRNDVSD
jgi:hypothetical protein